MDVAALFSILDSTIRLATPILCACLAGLWSERAGVVDIGLEGKLLAGAFAAATVASLTGSAWLGLGAALFASLALGLVHGYGAIDRGGDQIVCGMAINMIAAGGTALAGAALFGEGGRTPPLAPDARCGALLFGFDALTWLALALVPLTMFTVFHTRLGLRLRASGESPHAVEAAGVSVRRVRYIAVTACGLLGGLGGASLSLTQAASFLPGMSAGKGFMALAALVFSKWRPGAALLVCLMFGFFDAASIRLPGASLPGIGAIPVQAIQALPYLMTVILLAGFVGRALPPAAAGKPYRRGE
jgi:simple sugar transport system permease protein